jgi:hypothetical protein
MKLADKMIAYCETQLQDEKSLANMKNKVLLPTIRILKEEIQKSGVDVQIMHTILHMLWPIIIIILLILLLCITILATQIYHIMRKIPRI